MSILLLSLCVLSIPLKLQVARVALRQNTKAYVSPMQDNIHLLNCFVAASLFGTAAQETQTHTHTHTHNSDHSAQFHYPLLVTCVHDICPRRLHQTFTRTLHQAFGGRCRGAGFALLTTTELSVMTFDLSLT